jgi:hypothetical protein
MRIAVLLAALAVSGCVVVPDEDWDEVPLQQDAQTRQGDRIQPGDAVRVRTREGKVHSFRVSRVEERAFYGKARNGKSYRVPYSTLSSIEINRADGEWVAVPLLDGACCRIFP